MKLSLFGRLAMALFASLALGLGMTACGGGTIGFMWVLGQQYNQIAGFKIDDFSGNLTDIPGAPFNSNGSNPVSIGVKPGGRYVFVLNQGTNGSVSTIGTGAGISVYSVGGDGVLTFQQSYQPQGYIPEWLSLDSTGSYLYVLTKYAPSYVINATNGLQAGTWSGPNNATGSNYYNNYNGDGAITVFSIDSATGRLSLVTNSGVQYQTVNIPFFPVGASPFMMKTASNCLLTVNSADNSITEYSVASAGQLTIGTSSPYPVTEGGNGTNVSISSINAGGSYVFLTDSLHNDILQYTVGSGCNLTAASGGGITANTQSGTATDPVWTLVDSTSKYLYVLNQEPGGTGTVTTAAANLTAYTINPTNGELQPITGSPYGVGSGPVCMVEDPSNQYMYISNHNDGTVTGKLLDPTTGILSQLSRGSTFPAVGEASCLAVSGAVD